jgi:hypothetical protein
MRLTVHRGGLVCDKRNDPSRGQPLRNCVGICMAQLCSHDLRIYRTIFPRTLDDIDLDLHEAALLQLASFKPSG